MHSILTKKQLFRDNESIYVQKSTSQPEYISKLHSHNFIEISYIISGECKRYEYGESCHAKKGDLFIVNYGTPHMDLPIENSKEPFISYDCTFTPDFLDENLINTTNFLDITSSFLFQSINFNTTKVQPLLKLTDSAFNEYEQIFESMHTEYIEQKKGYYDLLRSYLIELIIKIFRKLDSIEDNNSVFKQEDYINLAIQFIKNNYSKKISLDDIAYRSMLSKSYFSQLFKEVTGTSFLKYLQKIRIEHACDELLQTNKSINTIALESGFDDIKFFYTTFKKETSTTPGEFRKNKIELV